MAKFEIVGEPIASVSETSEPTQFEVGGLSVRWDGRLNWVIEKPITRTRREDGEKYDTVETVGYYGSAMEVYRRLLEEGLRTQGKTTEKAFLTKNAEIHAALIKAFQGAGLL